MTLLKSAIALWLYMTSAAPLSAAASAPVIACAFSPDGTSLVAAQSDTVLVLSGADASLQRTLKPDLERVTSITFGRDGKSLAIAGGDPGVSGRVMLMDWKSKRVLATGGVFTDLTTSVAFSPDGQTLAAASADGTVQLFSTGDAAVRLDAVARLEGHAGPVLSVVFVGDGKSVVTASADRSIKVWDAKTGTLQRTLTNHTSTVNCLAPRPARREESREVKGDAPFACASGSDDHSVRVWQPQIGRMVRIVRGHEGPILAVCYAPDGSALFSAGAEGIVRVIDADSDRITTHWRASKEWIHSLAVSPDGHHLATGDWAGNIKLWRLGNDGAQLEASHLPKR